MLAERPTLPLAARAALVLPRLGLGTAPLGGLFEEVSPEQAQATLRCALAEGVGLLDTAPLYGFGAAERHVGRALRALEGPAPLLCSKVGRLPRADAPPDLTQLEDGESIYRGAASTGVLIDFSAEGARRSVQESLRRLGVERLDLVHVHDPEAQPRRVLAETLPALERLRSEGTIGAIGLGSLDAEALAMLLRESETPIDAILLAGRYTLMDQSALGGLLGLCQERGVQVIAGGVLGSGLLAAPGEQARHEYRRVRPDALARARAVQRVCALHGVELRAAAIAFPAGHPAVSCVLVGARSPREVRQALADARREIPAELWRDLREAGLIDPEAPAPRGALLS